jgi:hypothetical protein
MTKKVNKEVTYTYLMFDGMYYKIASVSND